MIRDIASIKRDLENKKNNDIILKKDKIEKIFNEDPDILEILGQKEKRPLNKFVDKDNPTEEELKKREEIIEYNKKIQSKQIVPMLKLNGISKEVLNFIMFDIDDTEVSYVNETIKTQYVVVMCLVHEDDVYTEYGIMRHDLLSYLVKDLLNWSNVLGMQLKCTSDYTDIVDFHYYCRTLKFEIEAPNVAHNYMAMHNKYDRFKV